MPGTDHRLGIGGSHYKVTGHKGDGHWAYEIVRKLPLVKTTIRDAYPWDIEDN